MSNTAADILFIIAVFILLALSIFLRGRRTRNTPLDMVIGILAEVNYNEKLVENFSFHRGIGRLKTGVWKKNKDKIDFLPEELRTSLSQAFDMSEEVNGRIDAARKFKSDSYMAGIDVSKLRAPIAKCKQQLQEWLQANMQNPEYMPKRRGLFG